MQLSQQKAGQARRGENVALSDKRIKALTRADTQDEPNQRSLTTMTTTMLMIITMMITMMMMALVLVRPMFTIVKMILKIRHIINLEIRKWTNGPEITLIQENERNVLCKNNRANDAQPRSSMVLGKELLRSSENYIREVLRVVKQ
uniref:Uncharacterized protein n=1 Tax=Glossina brevipalpis TaxID=37001 RepID=A0A1A9WZ50_9MUSC